MTEQKTVAKKSMVHRTVGRTWAATKFTGQVAWEAKFIIAGIATGFTWAVLLAAATRKK